jgi:DNA-binding NtrC family response regulator
MGSDPLRAAPAPVTLPEPGPFGGAPAPSAAGISVLVLDAEPTMRSFMQRGLARHFAFVEGASDRSEAADLLRRCHFDLLIADIGPTGTGGLAWVQALRDQGNDLDVIFVAADADLDSAIAALRAGACDFILKPFRIEQLLASAQRSAERRSARRETLLLHREIERHQALGGLVGDCASMHEVCAIIQRIAPMPSTVLIEGESGTGKELAARAIHTRSGRPGGFVAINCGAVSPDLLESELFGHVKGAFTGAHQAREGLFGFAQGGTLFLDEIAELPLGLQAKLLRVLEEKTVRPVGSNEQVPVDVRIIAATNRTLASEVTAGRFREDLFYRLNVVVVRLPPLRERREDIVLLARYFLDRLSAELGIAAPDWDGWDLDQLRRYDWPGNVRELRNVIERCLLLGRRPGHCIGEPSAATAAADGEADLSLASVERSHILRVLEITEGNKSDAARRLRVSRKTLERKLKDWGRTADPGRV